MSSNHGETHFTLTLALQGRHVYIIGWLQLSEVDLPRPKRRSLDASNGEWENTLSRFLCPASFVFYNT